MAKRRPSGDGMVRKKEDGSWEGRVVIGYDEKNLPKTKNVLAKTKSECVEKLKQLQEQYAPPKSDKIKLEMPFGEWMDFWYQNYSKPKLRPTTRSGYPSIHLYCIVTWPAFMDLRFPQRTLALVFSLSDWAKAPCMAMRNSLSG